MRADFGLRGGREDRFGELFGHLEAFGQLHAADGPRRAVVLPAAADQVAAGHAFDEDGLQAHRDDGTAAHLFDFFGLDDRFGVDAGQVIRQNTVELVEPEVRESRQNLALAGDRVVQDDVKGGNAVRGHDEELVLANRVAFANLAAVDLFQRRDVCFRKTGHVCTPKLEM